MNPTCGEAADFLEARFYEYCPREKYTDAAQDHVRRLAEFTVCYALECHYAGDENWWDEVGQAYWLKHVSCLHAKRLVCPRDDGLISCTTLQAAVNEQVDHTKVLLKRAIAMGRIDGTLLKFSEDFRGAVDGDVALFALLSGCPFLADVSLYQVPFAD